MAPLRTTLSVVLIAAIASPTSAGTFLGALNTTIVDDELEMEFANPSPQLDERRQVFMSVLQSSFVALPKDQDGRLQHQTARYILHRFFVQQHGWYIKGLEPSGDVFHTQSSDDSYRNWVPSYLVDMVEKRLNRKGLSLHDLAVLAASLEDLIRIESTELVSGIFTDFTKRYKHAPSVEDAGFTYLASFLSNRFWDAETAVISKERFIREYHGWERSRDWYKAIEEGIIKAGPPSDLDKSKAIAIDIGATYGSFNDQQCTELKNALLGMWQLGATTGRVRLADFYRMGLDTQWDLVEKREYLSAIGALDESNASSPLVIIPNYLTARPNCLEATDLYSVCCRNACEDLLEPLERQIAASEAEPARILELVSMYKREDIKVLSHQQYDALAERLQNIADQHGGKVKLHGRLFAQWMHHAFPQDCPYPHEAGAADPTSPDQWLGEQVEASEEERRQFVEAETCGPEEAAVEWKVELPWSNTEELLDDGKAQDLAPRRADENAVGWPCKLLMLVAALSAGAGAVALLAKKPEMVAQVAAAVEKVTWQQALLAVLALVGIALNIVNWLLLVIMLCVSILLQRMLAVDAQRAQERKEKTLV